MIKETEITCPPGQHGDEGVLITLAASALNTPANKVNKAKPIKIPFVFGCVHLASR